MNRSLLYIIAATLLIVVVGAALVPRFLSEDESYNGTVVDASGPPEEFVLEGPDGDVNLSDYRGQLVVMYFGYTNCPDFCPTTLSKLKKVRADLGDDAEDIQVLMVSVDPARDTPSRLEQYMSAFDESFVGLTGSEAEVNAVASQFGVYVAKADGSADSGYLVDHGTTMVVLDRDGRQRLFLAHDLTSDQIENDLENLL